MPEFEPCDLADLATQVARRAQSATTKQISVEIDESTSPVMADQIYLSQILANLLENAVRHGGTRIRIRGRNRPDERVQISVEDDGPGVPNAALPHLFEKFYQAGPAGEDKRRGMGIGMTVVAGLTQAMRGSVDACRSQLGGLRVDVCLRAAAVPADTEAETEGDPAADMATQ